MFTISPAFSASYFSLQKESIKIFFFLPIITVSILQMLLVLISLLIVILVGLKVTYSRRNTQSFLPRIVSFVWLHGKIYICIWNW